MIVGALFALIQTDLKRLLAFSTISQLGYIMTAFGIGTPYGALAGAFYVFSHGLYKGTLFLCSGAVQHAAGTRDMRRLGGLSKYLPGTTLVWLVAAAAIIGVPLTNGFVAKWLLYDAALESGAWVVIIVAWLVSTFTAFYILKATVSVFFGEPSSELQIDEINDASPLMQMGMGILSVACLFFGVFPQALVRWIAAPAITAMQFALPEKITFLGLRVDSSGAPITAGALLTISALLVVFFIFALRRPTPKGVSSFTGGDPLPEGGTLNAVDFSEFAEESFSPAFRILNPDPVYLWIWRTVTRIAESVKIGFGFFENNLVAFLIGAILIIAALVFVI